MLDTLFIILNNMLHILAVPYYIITYLYLKYNL